MGRNHERRGEGRALYRYIRPSDLRPWISISFLVYPSMVYIVEYHYIIKMHVFGVPTYFIQNANRGDLYLLLISEAAPVDK